MTIGTFAAQAVSKAQKSFDVPAVARNAKTEILSAIEKAASKTGVDFAYLVEKAAAESSFNPTAKAKTSSASGLYQFIDQTWLQMVKLHGHKHGLGDIADKIQRLDNGRYTITDASQRQNILNLKNNPDHAANMAAEFAKSNGDYLKHHVRGIDIGATELYFAHFMGAGGAARFFNAMKQNPDQNAAQIFSKEAAANKNVFFDQKGNARSLKQIYAFFDKKFGQETVSVPATVASATTTDTATTTATAQKIGAENIAEHAHAQILSAQTNLLARLSGMQNGPSQFNGNFSGKIARTPTSMGLPRLIDPINLLMMADMNKYLPQNIKF